ncbi:MAG TPA: hypothetical protein VFR34_06730, partial [Paracoccaceae bacterium]|nr:hypothetical protein [Paracoccaceae bacterium]
MAQARAMTGAAKEAAEAARGRLPRIVLLFLIALVIPVILKLGPLTLSVYRLLLLLALLPCLMIWLSGRAGRIRTADIALLVLCFWSALSIVIVHGAGAAIEPSGILFIETMGAYLVARCFIRDAESFRLMVVTLFRIVAIMLPFALYESVTGHNIMRAVFAAFFPVGYDIWMEPRWGLDRVQGPFEHPILFGVFCGALFGLVHYVLGFGQSTFRRLNRAAIIGLATLLSL